MGPCSVGVGAAKAPVMADASTAVKVSFILRKDRRSEGLVVWLLDCVESSTAFYTHSELLPAVQLVPGATDDGSSGSRPVIREDMILVVCAIRMMKLRWTLAAGGICLCYSRVISIPI